MVLRLKPEKVEERERIRLSLLHAAVTLAAKHGFAGLGLREVARGADIAPTSFYRHFTDMEELALALVSELVGPLLARWNEQVSKPAIDPHKPVQGLIDEALRAVREEPDLMRFVLAERVGAVRTCRAALRSKLSELAKALSTHAVRPVGSRTSHGEGAAAARTEAQGEAIVTLLLDSCAIALDMAADAPHGLDSLRSKLESQLRPLLRTSGEAEP